jgi:hypothetical protein
MAVDRRQPAWSARGVSDAITDTVAAVRPVDLRRAPPPPSGSTA